MCGVQILDLPCLSSGHNLNLTYEDMADLWRQGIAVNDENDPAPKTFPIPVNSPLTQPEDENSWRYEGIIFPRRSNNLNNTNTVFKNSTREEVLKMTKLKFFLGLFPVDSLSNK